MFGKKLLQSVAASSSSPALPSFLAGSEPPNQEVVATRLTPGTDWMRPAEDSGSGNTRLTAVRLTRRFALMPSSRPLISARKDCSVQNRKMHTDMASTVEPVRIQFRFRCLKMKGMNFMWLTSLIERGRRARAPPALDPGGLRGRLEANAAPRPPRDPLWNAAAAIRQVRPSRDGVGVGGAGRGAGR